jgi:hypothetical protein
MMAITLALLVILIGAPILVIKVARPWCYYTVALVFAAIIFSSEWRNGLGFVIGLILASMIVPVLASLVYWFVSGRKRERGRLTTAKIFFWCAFGFAILIRWSRMIAPR